MEPRSFTTSTESNSTQHIQCSQQRPKPEAQASTTSPSNLGKSNMRVQQAQLTRLASQENAEKGFGKKDKPSSRDFTDLLRVTEEMIRLLHAKRMRDSKGTGPST